MKNLMDICPQDLCTGLGYKQYPQDKASPPYAGDREEHWDSGRIFVKEYTMMKEYSWVIHKVWPWDSEALVSLAIKFWNSFMKMLVETKMDGSF